MVVVIHAMFCLIGYCVINKRVRENLNRTCLRCIGRKVPLLDSSQAVSVSSQNATTNPRSPGGYLGSNYDTSRKHIGISASSTTSKSTNKTGSSPYRSDGVGQVRHTSTSTSNYNSDSQSFGRGYGSKRRQRDDRHGRRSRKDSDSGSETDGRSLELASSHSSDDDESRVDGNRSTLKHVAISTPSYLPNITEHVTATTPPELNVIQSPQLFPSVRTAHGTWSSQAPEPYLSNQNGNFSFGILEIERKLILNFVF